MTAGDILIVGGYGEVGRRLAAQLEATQPKRVIVAGRHPEQANGMPARRIDVDDPASIEVALEGVDVVVPCVRLVSGSPSRSSLQSLSWRASPRTGSCPSSKSSPHRRARSGPYMAWANGTRTPDLRAGAAPERRPCAPMARSPSRADGRLDLEQLSS